MFFFGLPSDPIYSLFSHSQLIDSPMAILLPWHHHPPFNGPDPERKLPATGQFRPRGWRLRPRRAFFPL